MTSEQLQRFSSLLERVIHKYTRLEQQAWDYGNGISLSRAEMQTIMLLHAHPGIGVTALAKHRGITKGAASQLVYKMTGRGLIEKRGSPASDAQVCLFLTPLGQEVHQLHESYHRSSAEPFAAHIRALSVETADELVRLMEDIDRALDTRLDTARKARP